MPGGDRPTVRPMNAPTVLTIECSPQLEQRLGHALLNMGALLKRTKLENAATMVAERRPLVMVVPQDIYAFDPDEFDALARDVGASLLRVDDGASEAVLEMLLGPALEAARVRRQKQGIVTVVHDDALPPSARKTSARRRSWLDLELDAPPASSRSGRA